MTQSAPASAFAKCGSKATASCSTAARNAGTASGATSRTATGCGPEYVRQWFQQLKDLNMNYVRMHTFPHPDYFFDIADEMGILLCEESALHGSGQAGWDTPELWPRAEAHVRRIVRRDKNHPSLVIYSVENEMRWSLNIVPGAKDKLPELRRLYNAARPDAPGLSRGRHVAVERRRAADPLAPLRAGQPRPGLVGQARSPARGRDGPLALRLALHRAAVGRRRGLRRLQAPVAVDRQRRLPHRRAGAGQRGELGLPLEHLGPGQLPHARGARVRMGGTQQPLCQTAGAQAVRVRIRLVGSRLRLPAGLQLRVCCARRSGRWRW